MFFHKTYQKPFPTTAILVTFCGTRFVKGEEVIWCVVKMLSCLALHIRYSALSYKRAALSSTVFSVPLRTRLRSEVQRLTYWYSGYFTVSPNRRADAKEMIMTCAIALYACTCKVFQRPIVSRVCDWHLSRLYRCTGRIG